jgi:hypothetical protein
MVEGNPVGYGVMYEGDVEYSFDGASDGGVEGVRYLMACCWQWIEGPHSTGGCGSCSVKDHGIMEYDGDGGVGEDCFSTVGT